MRGKKINNRDETLQAADKEQDASGHSPDTLARCRQCGLEIPTRARLCHHCNSHQDWRGYLSLSSAVLALLIALISVLSTAVPAILAAVRGEDSRLTFSMPIVRENQIFVVASNLGSRPGVIESSRMMLADGDRYLVAELDDQSLAMIPPGSQQIRFRLHLERPPERMRDIFRSMSDPISEPQMHITAREFSGQERSFDLPLRWIPIRVAVLRLQHECEAMDDTPERAQMCVGIERQ